MTWRTSWTTKQELLFDESISVTFGMAFGEFASLVRAQFRNMLNLASASMIRGLKGSMEEQQKNESMEGKFVDGVGQEGIARLCIL